MGYCMYLHYQKFHIAADKKADALAAIKKLRDVEQEKGGGYHSLNGTKVRHWSWMGDQPYWECATLERAMKLWRWPVYCDDPAENDERGDVNEIEFTGEKMGDDQVLFNAIAPYVTDGSYLEMVGEDGERWRWVFKNGECREVTATVTFSETNCWCFECRKRFWHEELEQRYPNIPLDRLAPGDTLPVGVCNCGGLVFLDNACKDDDPPTVQGKQP